MFYAPLLARFLRHFFFRRSQVAGSHASSHTPHRRGLPLTLGLKIPQSGHSNIPASHSSGSGKLVTRRLSERLNQYKRQSQEQKFLGGFSRSTTSGPSSGAGSSSITEPSAPKNPRPKTRPQPAQTGGLTEVLLIVSTAKPLLDQGGHVVPGRFHESPGLLFAPAAVARGLPNVGRKLALNAHGDLVVHLPVVLGALSD